MQKGALANSLLRSSLRGNYLAPLAGRKIATAAQRSALASSKLRALRFVLLAATARFDSLRPATTTFVSCWTMSQVCAWHTFDLRQTHAVRVLSLSHTRHSSFSTRSLALLRYALPHALPTRVRVSLCFCPLPLASAMLVRLRRTRLRHSAWHEATV